MTFTLQLGTLRASGYLASTITAANATDSVVTDPGCRITANYSYGVTPVDDPDAPLSGRVITRCLGAHDIEAGSVERESGPAFDARRLAAGTYLAVLDFGDARSSRLTATFEVPER